MDLNVPICPLMSSDQLDRLCVGDQCAWYVAPVRKCALYVLGHKSAVDLQHTQKPAGQ